MLVKIMIKISTKEVHKLNSSSQRNEYYYNSLEKIEMLYNFFKLYKLQKNMEVKFWMVY